MATLKTTSKMKGTLPHFSINSWTYDLFERALAAFLGLGSFRCFQSPIMFLSTPLSGYHFHLSFHIWCLPYWCLSHRCFSHQWWSHSFQSARAPSSSPSSPGSTKAWSAPQRTTAWRNNFASCWAFHHGFAQSSLSETKVLGFQWHSDTALCSRPWLERKWSNHSTN